MIKKLEKIIKKKGLIKVICDLGYSSTEVIYYWRKKGIPKKAEKKVKKYIEENLL